MNCRKAPERLRTLYAPKFCNGRCPAKRWGVALFRGIRDRLVSLRLLNQARAVTGQCEFDKSYSPCVIGELPHPWYAPLRVELPDGTLYRIYLCEPDMVNPDHQDALLSAVERAFAELPIVGGYYDIPDLRDWVCECLLIPDAAFDEGINQLLDRQPSPLSVGLQYDRISGRRRPLVRLGRTTQIHNLIRRI